ncbi:MAG TPA: M23 family metallopeptidase [Dehalococcoidia bacterium]|jgi:murein DD-endopeptidase MepM/ murein hydrolase activator NlpD|nr:M23 family metallopeptidase [Dehalococcoidia bacterium]
MTSNPARLLRASTFAGPLVFAILTLTACGGDSLPQAPTRAPADAPTVVSASTAEVAPSATTAASATTAPPSATAVPPTATPAPATGISFQPAQLQQGGTAVVYLNETAINATLTFGGRQYPMVQAGNRWWTVIGVGAFTSPGLAPVTVAYTPAQGAAVRSITQSLSITDRDYPVSHITLDPATASLLAPDIVNNEIAQRAAIFSGYTAQKLWNGAFQRPAEGPLSDRYGEGRSYNGSPVTDYHKGTDFVGGIGDPVYAAAAGRVVFTGELRVRGNAIIIDHGLGVFTAYHHLSAIKVVQGAIVAPGQRIGDIGSTGLVTGPHLHWEVIVRGVEVDGEYWLSDISLGP